jgi:hypothetical protein
MANSNKGANGLDSANPPSISNKGYGMPGRAMESYIARERPAPQPSSGKDMSRAIEREHAKRRNGGK